jgi:hypothetical protein
MNELQHKLRLTTHEFMVTNCKNSHKRTKLFLEMQELNRRIKALQIRNENINY